MIMTLTMHIMTFLNICLCPGHRESESTIVRVHSDGATARYTGDNDLCRDCDRMLKYAPTLAIESRSNGHACRVDIDTERLTNNGGMLATIRTIIRQIRTVTIVLIIIIFVVLLLLLFK